MARFQSTLPLRGATNFQLDFCAFSAISIHAPLTGSDTGLPVLFCAGLISIHAPLTGSDRWFAPTASSRVHFNPRSPYGERQSHRAIKNSSQGFQSTLPLRGATRNVKILRKGNQISIHAPLTGSDVIPYHLYLIIRISIHAPLTGSDRGCPCFLEVIMISIHAPLTGSDSKTAQNFT